MAEFDSVIPAGGSGKLTAKIRTASTQQGRVSKSISVTTDARDMERITLSMTFAAVPVVTVLPRPRVFISGVHGEELSATLLVRRNDGEPFDVTGVELGDPRLLVTTERIAEEKVVDGQKALPGDVLVVASVARDTEPATVNGRFRIRTDHPEAPMIDVPFSIRLRPVIEVRPAQLRLLLEDGNPSGRTTLIRVLHNQKGTFKVTGLDTSASELIKAQLVDGDGAQQVHTVALMFQDEVVPGSLDGTRMESLTLSTDDAAQPTIKVPVMIEAREPRRPRPPQPLP